MRVLFICGDRNWTNRQAIRETFDLFRPQLVIEGAARGADELAGLEARERGIDLEEYPANWNHFHRAAGPIRNAEMCNRLMDLRLLGHEITCRAFHENIDASKGTKNMLRLLDAAGFDYEVIS